MREEAFLHCMQILNAWSGQVKKRWAEYVGFSCYVRYGEIPCSIKSLLREVLLGLPTLKSNPNQPRVPVGFTTGGEFTRDGTNGGVPTDDDILATWGSADTLQDHFERHGQDFEATSPQDYAGRAHQFYQRFLDEKLPAVQGSDKVVRVYEPGSNSFGSYNDDGTTRTFFKPPNNVDYYLQQVERDTSTGGHVINSLPSEGGGGGGGGGLGPFGKPGDELRRPWEIEE